MLLSVILTMLVGVYFSLWGLSDDDDDDDDDNIEDMLILLRII